ncbi:MAG TPA: hypothetical protein VFK37_08130 [Bacillales bacterium]|nr:hypothetical protein [Bacillales bacterium]
MALDRDELHQKLDDLLDQHDVKKVKVKVKNTSGERFDFEVRNEEKNEEEEVEEEE